MGPCVLPQGTNSKIRALRSMIGKLKHIQMTGFVRWRKNYNFPNELANKVILCCSLSVGAGLRYMPSGPFHLQAKAVMRGSFGSLTMSVAINLVCGVRIPVSSRIYRFSQTLSKLASRDGALSGCSLDKLDVLNFSCHSAPPVAGYVCA